MTGKAVGLLHGSSKISPRAAANGERRMTRAAKGTINTINGKGGDLAGIARADDVHFHFRSFDRWHASSL
jgi:hypothetical protein